MAADNMAVRTPFDEAFRCVLSFRPDECPVLMNFVLHLASNQAEECHRRWIKRPDGQDFTVDLTLMADAYTACEEALARKPTPCQTSAMDDCMLKKKFKKSCQNRLNRMKIHVL